MRRRRLRFWSFVTGSTSSAVSGASGSRVVHPHPRPVGSEVAGWSVASDSRDGAAFMIVAAVEVRSRGPGAPARQPSLPAHPSQRHHACPRRIQRNLLRINGLRACRPPGVVANRPKPGKRCANPECRFRWGELCGSATLGRSVRSSKGERRKRRRTQKTQKGQRHSWASRARVSAGVRKTSCSHLRRRGERMQRMRRIQRIKQRQQHVLDLRRTDLSAEMPINAVAVAVSG